MKIQVFSHHVEVSESDEPMVTLFTGFLKPETRINLYTGQGAGVIAKTRSCRLDELEAWLVDRDRAPEVRVLDDATGDFTPFDLATEHSPTRIEE